MLNIRELMHSGTDAPVAPEDRAPGALRGAGARSPIFWKSMLVAMALMWGFSFFVMKDVLESVPTFLLLSCRFVGAALIMLLLFHRRVAAHLNVRYLVVGLGMGLLMWAAYGLQTLGLVETTAGKNAFLTGTYCIIVPFVSFFVFRESLTRYNVGAALICLAGIALVALDNLSVNRGDVLTLAGACFFAVQIATAAHYGRDLDVNVITFWMFLAVGVLSVATSVATEPQASSVAWTPELVGVLAFLSVFCTCLGLLVQNLALAHVPSSIGSLLLSLESPSGVFFSVLLAGEQLTGRLVAGFVLIFVSIVFSETRGAFLLPVIGRIWPDRRRRRERAARAD